MRISRRRIRGRSAGGRLLAVALVSSGAGTAAASDAAPSSVVCEHVGSGTDYQVGPGKAYATPSDVPFETLQAGDTVRIFYKAEPYRDKLMIGGVATAAQPIRVCGVPGPNGERPIIDGENAVTRPQLDFPFDGHQLRGLIVVGHPHDTPYEETPEHIIVEGFEIRNAREPNTFTDKAGQVVGYYPNAAGIFGERARYLTIRDNVIHDNGNGLFIGTGGGQELSSDILIEGNYIYGNGYVDSERQHNVYCEVSGIVYQYNRFGPPKQSDTMATGAGIKERSAGVVIRYNWIDGGSHLIDLVDSQEARPSNAGTPEFQNSHVYGNVLITRRFTGGMVHYGGDSGDNGTCCYQYYRKGTLHFYQNTVIVENESFQDYQEQDVFELSTDEEHLEARNNIFWSTQRPPDVQPIILLGRRDATIAGTATFSSNMIRPGWSAVDPSPNYAVITAVYTGFESSFFVDSPGFGDPSDDDFNLVEGAPARRAGEILSATFPAMHPVLFEYVRHQAGEARYDPALSTLGALANLEYLGVFRAQR